MHARHISTCLASSNGEIRSSHISPAMLAKPSWISAPYPATPEPSWEASPVSPMLLARPTSTSHVASIPMAKHLHVSTISPVPMVTQLYRQLQWWHPLKNRPLLSIVLKQILFNKMFVKMTLFDQFIAPLPLWLNNKIVGCSKGFLLWISWSFMHCNNNNNNN